MNVEPKKRLKQLSVTKNTYDNISIGQSFTIKDVTVHRFITTTSYSIGKGFSGVMKRHNFRGFPASHGTHETFRHGGSIGGRTQPGRVFKGKKMAGRMGNDKKTIKNIEIVKSIEDEELILVKGSIPGHRKSIVIVKVDSNL